MELFLAQFSFDLEIIIMLILALSLGGILGFEREYSGKAAGIRTYGLVALGAAIFTYLSREGFTAAEGGFVDPTRIAAQVVVGIGFLGAGLIIFRESHLEGLTTAAGLWLVAAIGMAVGAGIYGLAISATVIGFVTLTILGKFDVEKFKKHS